MAGPQQGQKQGHEDGQENIPAGTAKKENALAAQPPPLMQRLGYGSYIYTLQGLLVSPVLFFQGWKEYFCPPDGGPNIVKYYDCRPSLPVHIFFPASHDLTSPALLPTLITIHGGGFCLGSARDAVEWNREFADTQGILVVSLSYSKAPGYPFPTALHDLEALYGAVMADESLPIARAGSSENGPPSRLAVLGFSAGGNLAMALSQLPAVRQSANAPRAAVSVYGALDLSATPEAKARTRQYKTRLPWPRGSAYDHLIKLAPVFDWAYIPYGQDLRDPLLSPVFAPEAHLPPWVCVVAAELDMLAHESWRLAVRLGNERFGAGREMPDTRSDKSELAVSGRKAPSRRRGALEDENGGDERFGWEEEGGGRAVKWMLVPDVIHGFDCVHLRNLMGGEEAVRDAEEKMRREIEALGRWLRRAWGV